MPAQFKLSQVSFLFPCLTFPLAHALIWRSQAQHRCHWNKSKLRKGPGIKTWLSRVKTSEQPEIEKARRWTSPIFKGKPKVESRKAKISHQVPRDDDRARSWEEKGNQGSQVQVKTEIETWRRKKKKQSEIMGPGQLESFLGVWYWTLLSMD